MIDLLHVLGRVIALEPQQAELLSTICNGPLIPLSALAEAGLSSGNGSTDHATEDVDNEN